MLPDSTREDQRIEPMQCGSHSAELKPDSVNEQINGRSRPGILTRQQYAHVITDAGYTH